MSLLVCGILEISIFPNATLYFSICKTTRRITFDGCITVPHNNGSQNILIYIQKTFRKLSVITNDFTVETVGLKVATSQSQVCIAVQPLITCDQESHHGPFSKTFLLNRCQQVMSLKLHTTRLKLWGPLSLPFLQENLSCYIVRGDQKTTTYWTTHSR